MKKYQIVLLKNDKALDARQKAPKDVERVLSECGYTPLYIEFQQNHTSTFKRIIAGILVAARILKALLKVPNGSEIFLQYPTTRYWYLFAPLLKWKKIRTGIILHDIESFRQDGAMSDQDVQELLHFDKIVAHHEAMTSFLVQRGIPTDRIRVFQIWDYYVEVLGTNDLSRSSPPVILFAGNLAKSHFLSELQNLHLPSAVFHLFGTGCTQQFFGSIEYKGNFHPDDLRDLNGTWGLVWDGDSISTCTGNMGEYLKINTSHKIGLYLAKGIPVIVWSESGVAPFITANKLGIAVNSLHELKDRLASITPQEMDAIRASVQVFSQKVRNGEMLKAALQTFDN